MSADTHLPANSASVSRRPLPARLPSLAVWPAMALVCALPLVCGDYFSFVALMVLINVIATTGVNLSMGYCGLVSVGHAGFVAIGAYVSTLLMSHFGINFFPAILIGALYAGLTGIVIGMPALRLNPLYIAMVSFGFGQAMYLVALNWIEVTGGPNGMAVPPATVGDYVLSGNARYWLTALLCFGLLYIARNIERSRLGRALVAIRDSQIAAQSMGVVVGRYKTIAFGIGALYGGLAGGLYAIAAQYVNPDAFVFTVSIMYVTMCVVGGLGTLWGPVLGGLLLTVLPEVLRPFAEYKEFLSGIILLGCLVLMPHGLVPPVRRALRSLSPFRACEDKPLVSPAEKS